MDNKAFASLGLIKNNEKSSDNVFMNAIFEHALPSGFSFLTTTESGTFNPNDYCVNKSTWTYSEITVVNSGDGKAPVLTNSEALITGVHPAPQITFVTGTAPGKSFYLMNYNHDSLNELYKSNEESPVLGNPGVYFNNLYVSAELKLYK